MIRFHFAQGRANEHGLTKKLWKASAAAAVFALMFSVPSFSQSGSPAISCESLATQNLPSVTITAATAVAAGELKIAPPSPGARPDQVAGPGGLAGGGAGRPAQQAGPGGAGAPAAPAAQAPRRPRVDFSKMPAICRVQATVKPSSENEAKFEVWLPAAGWNGSSLTVTHPSSAGGNINAEVIDGIQKGYAAVLNMSPSFDGWDVAAKSPDMLLDFGYREGHAMLVGAKAIAKAFYGTPIKHAYYEGCSEGGREGFNAASHYPEDYDGIIVGGAGIQFSIINAAQMYPAWFMSKDKARFIPQAKWTMIHNAVLDACDEFDGVKDRVIADPRQCNFKPESLLCKGAEADNCLTAPQIEALKATYKGTVNSRTGKVIFPGPAVGGELPVFEFANPDVPMRPAHLLYKALVFGDNPNWDWKTLDYDKDVALATQKVGAAIEIKPADLKNFLDHGGKLLYWDGWNDYNNPYFWMDFYAETQKLFGAEKVAKSFQMYFMPGVQHCGGGEGCDSFSRLDTIAGWVTTGKAPARILSSHMTDGKATNTRPICPYPQVAKYKGSGDTNAAENYVCAETKPGYKK